MDANAVINGAEMERVTRQMRFRAARYSMLKQAEAGGRIELAKVDTTISSGSGRASDGSALRDTSG